MYKIKGFFGPHEYLSNFFHAPMKGRVHVYPTNENFYQSIKVWYMDNPDWELQEAIALAATPNEAKKLGRSVQLSPAQRKLWDDKGRIEAMRAGLLTKFDQHPDLKEKLIKTSPWYLEETNTWKDHFWGVDGYGQNVLGCMLMELRGFYIYGEKIGNV